MHGVMMEQPFLILYRFFKKNRTAFRVTLLLLFTLLALGSWRIELEEDVTKFFPDDRRVEKLNYIFRNSKLSDRVVVMISMKDSADSPRPDDLVRYAAALSDTVASSIGTHITEVTARVDDEVVSDLFQSIHQSLPVYLQESDYPLLDSLESRQYVRRVLTDNYRQLLSPAGMATKNVIVHDPLGLSFPVMKRLQHLQFDENFQLYDNFIMTKDQRHVLFFIQPKYAAGESRNNGVLQEELDRLISFVASDYEGIVASYFGASVVAVGNAKQLQKDTILTLSIMLVVLLSALWWFFRRKRIPFLILMPVLFGGLFALATIAMFKGSLSILALAVGAVILGVAVDYSLHFLVYLKEERDTERVLIHLVKPLTIGSLTTVVAFLCLQFTNAAVLQDVGLFAALSLVGAAFFSLTFLPHLIAPEVVPVRSGLWLRELSGQSLERNKIIVWTILLLTPVFVYFAGDVEFNSDMSALNFMTEQTDHARKRIESINRSTLSAAYIVSEGITLDHALRTNEKAAAVLAGLKEKGTVQKVFSVADFLVSDSLQRKRIGRWNSFWTAKKKSRVSALLREEGGALGFSNLVLTNFDSLISRKYRPVSNDTTNVFRSAFYDDYIIGRDGNSTVISIVNAKPDEREGIYRALEGTAATGTDKQMLTNLFVEYVHADFNYIVTVTSALVFLALLLTYGRIELALITFVPMLFTWLWILGIMALIGIEFNIINIMVSTFIFGLGDDYSIFTMDGLLEEYRAGKKTLPAIRTSIMLSAFTTICGLGVLIFAKHPALRSIAAISIIGIASVFIMSLVMQPFFFRILISNRTSRGLPPMTFFGICATVFTYAFFVAGSFFLTFIGLLLKLIPFGKNRVRLFFHALISFFTRALVYLSLNLKKKIIGRTELTFSRPTVVVANHASFLDILLTTMLHPKLILLTNKWVWNSPVFGGVVRLADYYPVMDGAQDSVERVKDRVEEGYSIVVFPEGTRSEDGTLKRFHKGAFYLADHLKLPVQPLLIHGAGNGIRKGEIYLNNAYISLKFLPPIEADDLSFGEGYSERTKKISRYFRSEYEKLSREHDTADSFAYRLKMNYIYKGPVLEWYMRVKLRLEKNYKIFNDLVPRKGKILDLGCGYGFLPYMLRLLSKDRTVTGVDYDEQKIETAKHGYLKDEGIEFVCADVTSYPLGSYDAIIISDVLHYLSTEEQDELLTRCFAALNSGGTLIIRDGNRDLQERHRGTKATEFFSVKLLKFNKSRNDLNFISGGALTAMAESHGLSVKVLDETRYTSNVIFVITKPTEVHATV
jgi:uncharacterized protein